ncbi:MAG: hypothetical protein VKL39_18385 [Leptolyngbyaceae bacterium]|nr:hypothetical protein [Leptolyngbyaceae bacterium]
MTINIYKQTVKQTVALTVLVLRTLQFFLRSIFWRTIFGELSFEKHALACRWRSPDRPSPGQSQGGSADSVRTTPFVALNSVCINSTDIGIRQLDR